MFRGLAAVAVILACILAVSARQDRDKVKPKDRGEEMPKSIYQHGPDPKEQEGVSRGKEVAMGVWKSKVFAGIERSSSRATSTSSSWARRGTTAGTAAR